MIYRKARLIYFASSPKDNIPQERKINIEGDQLELDIELKKKEAQNGNISISATPWAYDCDRR